MIVLSVETSSLHGSLALFRQGLLLGQKTWSKLGSHSEAITLATKNLLYDHNIELNEIQRIATGTGPGSFTGLRVAVNFARTLAYSYNLPVFPFNSLHLQASGWQKKSAHPVCVAQFAFRDLFYCSTYAQDFGQDFISYREILPPKAATASQIKELITQPHVLIGDGYNQIKAALGDEFSRYFFETIDPTTHAEAKNFLFTRALDQNPAELTDWIHTIPLYIRASEAEEKLKMGTTFSRN